MAGKWHHLMWIVAVLSGFCAVFAFANFPSQRWVWTTMLASSGTWFLVEAYRNLRNRIVLNALVFGFVVSCILFAMEEMARWLKLWSLYGGSFLFFGIPAELVAVYFFCSVAWALYIPRKFDWGHSIIEVVMVGFLLTLVEYILGWQWMIVGYGAGWTSAHTFIKYLVLLSLCHCLWYCVFGRE
ncbi:MAG: hypothetical protein QXP42_01095 [Candidatus Micrarchaeia archaeon]